MEVRDLPALNATLNSMSAMLLLFGYYFIKQKEIERHRLCMGLAFLTSCLFLTSYVIYHLNAGSVPFTGEGWIRTLYFAILLTHIPLAALVPVMAIVAIYRAWKKDFVGHRRIARWTWPIWMYVSVSGVVIYIMLYEM
jgi:putative membrane protein